VGIRTLEILVDKKQRRIEELEQAIRDAESWVQCGEGVRLIYYYRDWLTESTAQRSKKVIEEVLQRDQATKV